MAYTITATPDPYTYVARLLIAGGVPPYTVQAQPSGGRPAYTVRSPQSPVTGDATARNMVDGQIPLGAVATVYQATDSTGAQVQSTAITVPAALPVLSDALDINKFQTVTVVAQKPNHWAARSVWYDVLGRREPTTAVGPLRLVDGQLVVTVPDYATRFALIALLSTGDPLILRTPCPNVVDDVTFVVTEATERLLNDRNADGVPLFELRYQAVTSDLGPFAGNPSRTYADLPPAWPTYADLLPAFATYGDLTTGASYVNQGPNLVTKGWANSSDAASWNTGWSQHLTSLTSAGGVGRLTSDGAGVGTWVMIQTSIGLYNMPTVPGKRYRITFRARLAAGTAGAQAVVEMVTNTSPGTADYFQPGAIGVSSPPVTLSGAWSPVSIDYTVPAGDDVATFAWRINNAASGCIVEIDAPSLRELTG